MKYNRYGDTLWTRTFGDSVHFYTFYQALVDRQGNILEIGITNKSGNVDSWLIKTDTAGNKLWERTFSKTLLSESLTSIAETTDGGYILGGWRDERELVGSPKVWANISDPMLIKVDSMGREEWTYIYDTPYNEANAYVIQTMDGN
jgi:hypothetical protein